MFVPCAKALGSNDKHSEKSSAVVIDKGGDFAVDFAVVTVVGKKEVFVIMVGDDNGKRCSKQFDKDCMDASSF